MIILDVPQRSEEWYAGRIGIPTASSFDRILTPTGKPSSQQMSYMGELIAEWATGTPAEMFTSSAMDEGIAREPESKGYYEFETGLDVTEVGLVYLDEQRMIGCSPDGLIGDDGGLEMKNPAPHTHVGYVLESAVPKKYTLQVQGCLWICQRDWWDFMSYHPDFPPLIYRARRNEKLIKVLSAEVNTFVEKMLEQRERFTRKSTETEKAT